MTKRRTLATAFNKQVALAAHYQVHANQISQWKKQAIDGHDGVFDNKKAYRARDADVAFSLDGRGCCLDKKYAKKRIIITY